MLRSAILRDEAPDDLQPTPALEKRSRLRYEPPRRVLVLGIIPSLTWSVTRCLTRAGMAPVVLGWHAHSPLQWLADCTYVPLVGVRWVNGELDPALIDQVEAACKQHAIDIVLPSDFPAVQLLARYGRQIRSARVALVPDADLMTTLHDKHKFSQTLQVLGIPQPHTELARDADALLCTRLAFPIITKPVDRWASVGFQIHHSRRALERTIRRGGLQAEFPLLVQEFIAGRDVGFAFLARRGRLLAHTAFDQPRIGARRYFDAPQLARMVEQFVDATGYEGLGEIDTRYDPTRDTYHLLEINPRCWASILYAAHAGINFPQLLSELPEVGASAFAAATTPRTVRLSAFEICMAKAVQLAERWQR